MKHAIGFLIVFLAGGWAFGASVDLGKINETQCKELETQRIPISRRVHFYEHRARDLREITDEAQENLRRKAIKETDATKRANLLDFRSKLIHFVSADSSVREQNISMKKTIDALVSVCKSESDCLSESTIGRVNDIFLPKMCNLDYHAPDDTPVAKPDEKNGKKVEDKSFTIGGKRYVRGRS